MLHCNSLFKIFSLFQAVDIKLLDCCCAGHQAIFYTKNAEKNIKFRNIKSNFRLMVCPNLSPVDLEQSVFHEEG